MKMQFPLFVPIVMDSFLDVKGAQSTSARVKQWSAKAPRRVQSGCFNSVVSFLKKINIFAQRKGKLDERHTTLVQPFENQQAFEGWGTSLCWFANIIGGFPDPLRNHLIDLVFDQQKGLGLEICRYNIGGSGWTNRDTGNFRYGADVESFWGPDGTWDWDQDKNQRWVLLQARERGTCHFEAFSNSPPYWMTYSGRASGNTFAWLDNLPPKNYDLFILYLTEVVWWYKETHGIIFRTVDPFNEPSSNYWWAGNNQEGCHFGAAAQNEIVVRLWKSLADAGLIEAGVSISASDETSIDLQCQSMYNYTPEALSCIAQINTHAYSGSRRQELKALVKTAGKRLWMSEVGFGGYPPEDVRAGLDISRRILEDLNVMQANAWVYWQAIENDDGGTWWGLLQVPFHGGSSINMGKQYYCFLQYTKFIKSGWTILSTSQPGTTLAATCTKKSKIRSLVLVVSNFDDNGRLDEFDLSRLEPGTVCVQVWRTSGHEDFQSLKSFTLQHPARFKYTAPALSITTFKCDMEAPPA